MGALETLRAATGAAHHTLDERLHIMQRLACPRRRRLLVARLHTFYAAAEGELTPFLDRLPGLDYSERLKAPVLSRDVATLDHGETDLALLETPPAVPVPRTQAEALGGAYVLEGATLGGQVIRKMAAAAGLNVDGLGFYNCYGEHTASMWRKFCVVLEQNCTSEESRHQAASGAVNMFAAIEGWLCQPE